MGLIIKRGFKKPKNYIFNRILAIFWVLHICPKIANFTTIGNSLVLLLKSRLHFLRVNIDGRFKGDISTTIYSRQASWVSSSSTACTKHSNFGFQPQNFRAQMVWIWRVSLSMLSLSSMFLGWNVKHHFKWKREMESITMKTFFCRRSATNS